MVYRLIKVKGLKMPDASMEPAYPLDLDEIIDATVQRTLQRFGIDTSDPIEVQKDFAHLRSWRSSTEAIKQKGILTAIGVIVVAFLGYLWSAFRNNIH